MSDFNPEEAARLAKEFAEDDERASVGRWRTSSGGLRVLTDAAETRISVFGVARTERDDDALAIARLRNNAHSAAEQLRGAAVEVASLCADNETLVAQRDSWRKVADRLALERDGEKMDAISKADRLSARVRELEAYVEMAADILDSCAARHSNADASVTATKIRAALAEKETL